MIKLEGKWMVTEALFYPEEDEKLARLGIATADKVEPCPMRFRLDYLTSWNEGYEDRPTLIHLLSGISCVINVPFKEFDNFILNEIK